MKKENLVEKAQQPENGSASWVGKLCVVRSYLFMHRQWARARGPLSLIKKMSGLINQHAAPSRVAAGSVTCRPNAAPQSYAVPPPPCDGSKKSTTNASDFSLIFPPTSGEDGGRRGKPTRLLQWRKVDPTVTLCVCVFWLRKLIFLKASLWSGHPSRAGRCQRPTASEPCCRTC